MLFPMQELKQQHSLIRTGSAVLHGEWGIDLSNNGDFGRARQVYVALNSPVGTISIGKQRTAAISFYC